MLLEMKWEESVDKYIMQKAHITDLFVNAMTYAQLRFGKGQRRKTSV